MLFKRYNRSKAVGAAALIFAGLLLASCASTGPLPPDPKRDAERLAAVQPNVDAAQTAASDFIGRMLKDPYSAQWAYTPLKSWDGRMPRSIFQDDFKPGWFMCGTVNAKNSFGGYVGTEWFLVHFDAATGRVVDQGYLKDTPVGPFVMGVCGLLYG